MLIVVGGLEKSSLSWIPADEPQSWHHQTAPSQSR